MTNGKYRTIVADPPWSFRNRATKADARNHYETMDLEAISEMDVSSMVESQAHLWLWAVNAMVGEAYAVVKAWGFRPLTMLTWCKPQPGVGYYLRNNTEHCILASRGEAMTPAAPQLASWFVWPRTIHSSKPDAFYDLVEQVSPGPYAELFARRARFGWDYPLGDQALGGVAA